MLHFAKGAGGGGGGGGCLEPKEKKVMGIL